MTYRMRMHPDLAPAFVARSQYYLGVYLGVEYPAKLRAALLAIPPDRLWWRPQPTANSAGNLVLHLAGNVRQWVVSGIGGAPDVRERDAEFAAEGGWDHARLLAHLDAACADAVAVIGTLDANALASASTTTPPASPAPHFSPPGSPTFPDCLPHDEGASSRSQPATSSFDNRGELPFFSSSCVRLRFVFQPRCCVDENCRTRRRESREGAKTRRREKRCLLPFSRPSRVFAPSRPAVLDPVPQPKPSRWKTNPRRTQDKRKKSNRAIAE
ncbi:MAG: DUF1572 domain-containing protein [Gemmatimonadaceae bacterium]|nr:DUF1572 domain-containing protein [Gemmatimonadaceae bacterium]